MMCLFFHLPGAMDTHLWSGVRVDGGADGATDDGGDGMTSWLLDPSLDAARQKGHETNTFGSEVWCYETKEKLGAKRSDPFNTMECLSAVGTCPVCKIVIWYCSGKKYFYRKCANEICWHFFFFSKLGLQHGNSYAKLKCVGVRQWQLRTAKEMIDENNTKHSKYLRYGNLSMIKF